MKRFLTAIALMVSLASPSGALMAQTEESTFNDRFLMVGIFLYSSFDFYRDKTCVGTDKYENFRKGMAASILDRNGSAFSTTEITRAEQFGEACMIVVFVPMPPSMASFVLSIGGVPIDPNLIQLKVIGGTQTLYISLP